MNSPERNSQIERKNSPSKNLEKTPQRFDPLEQRIWFSIAIVNDEYKNKYWWQMPDDIICSLQIILKKSDEKQRDSILDKISFFIVEYDNADVMIQSFLTNTIDELLDNESNNSQQVIEKEETTNEQKESARHQTALQLVDSVSSLSWEWKAYEQILKRIVALKSLAVDKWLSEELDAEIKAILSELEDPQTLFAVSLDLQAQDRKNGTHTYEAFKSSIIALEPGFKAKFHDADTRAMLALWTDTLKNTSRSGKTISHLTDDGFLLSAALDNTDRKLSRQGSKYLLASNLNTQTALNEVQAIESRLQKNIKPFAEGITTLNTLGRRLADALKEYKDFYTIKNELKNIAPEIYVQLRLDAAENPDDIMSRLSLQENILTQRIEELELEARKAKAQLIAETKARAKEKDAIKKETLSLISQIGVDTLSQNETDQVFAWLNTNHAIRESLWANALFDIENWILGHKSALDTGTTLSFQSKVVFVRTFNKMLTGSTEYPVWFDALWKHVFYQTLEDAENKRTAMMFDMQFFANQMLGWTGRIAKMIENLQKTEH